MFRWVTTMLGIAVGTTLGYMAASVLYVIAQKLLTPNDPGEALPAFLIGLAVFVPFGAIMSGGLTYRWATRRMQQMDPPF